VANGDSQKYADLVSNFDEHVRELREKNTSSNTKRHIILGGIMFIGGLVFAAVITAYAYNGDTNIFTFIVMVKN
jgi:cell division protein ZapA (FtsZ GTPase activity inhibitor)